MLGLLGGFCLFFLFWCGPCRFGWVGISVREEEGEEEKGLIVHSSLALEAIGGRIRREPRFGVTVSLRDRIS